VPLRHREETLNTQLAILLGRFGVRAEAETLHLKGRERPDVLFTWRGLRVVIEGKFADHPGARNTVLQEARGRVQRGVANLAAAVVYPQVLRNIPTTKLLSQLERVELEYSIVSEGGQTTWFVGSASALMGAFRRAHQAAADLDVVSETAKSLAERLEALAHFWMDQPGTCDRLSGILGMHVPEGEIGKKKRARRDTAARVSALVIANALIFQQQLAATDGRVTPLGRLRDEQDVVAGARAHWQWIWQNVNYVPIFQLADRVAAELPITQSTLRAFRSLLAEAMAICARQSALRHDLMGRIYHWLLHQAKYLGTYYTSVPAATVLLSLAIHRFRETDFGDPRVLAGFKVADLACGTGTLLMAAAQALSDAYILARANTGRALTPVDLQTLHRALMENILHGYDVLPSAVHLTASTLAMLAPEVAFVRMNLYVMLLGIYNGAARLGSLDFIGTDTVRTQFALDDSQAEIIRTGASRTQFVNATVPALDLCVMNPPFVRSVGGNLLFGSLPNERKVLQTELKKRVRNLHASVTAGLGAVFVALADQRVKEGGRLAFVLPHAASSGEAWGETRRLIADRYHLETVVSSYDAERPNFSENTDLSELLLIACKSSNNTGMRTTRYVNLLRNPATIYEALDLAERLKEDREGIITSEAGTWADVFDLPVPRSSENWHGALFSRGDLARAFLNLREGKLLPPDGTAPTVIPTCTVAQLGDIGPDRRRIHEAFDLHWDLRTPHPAFWDHEADQVRTLRQTPNAWLQPRKTPRYADRSATANYAQYPYHLWGMAADILLAERLRTNTHRVLAVGFDQPVLGNTWWALKTGELSSDRRKALLLWLNGTLSLLSFFGARVATHGAWMQMKKPAWEAMPVLDVRSLTNRQASALSRAYNELASQELLPLARVNDDPVRRAIDEALCGVLDLPDLTYVRDMLANEPGLTGQRAISDATLADPEEDEDQTR
jgi:hypothetical protein